jgi:hypothetical protein
MHHDAISRQSNAQERQTQMATRPIKLSSTDNTLDDLTDPNDLNSPSAALQPQPDANVKVVNVPETGAPTVSRKQVPPNRDADLKALLSEARAFGKQDGEGKRSHVRFARTCVRGGASKVLSSSPKSQSATQMYQAFTESSLTAAGGLTDAEKASNAAQLSKVRAFIRLGDKYTDEAEGIFDTAVDVHKYIMANPALNERAKLRSTYAAVCSIAVAQCRPERNLVPLTSAEMEGLLLNPPVEEKVTTGVTLLIQALNLSESAKRGKAATENKEGRDSITHGTLDNIIDAFRALISELDAAALQARDDEIEAMRQKKIKAAEAKAKRDADKEAKKREKEIQAGLSDETEVEEDDVEDLMDETETE